MYHPKSLMQNVKVCGCEFVREEGSQLIIIADKVITGAERVLGFWSVSTAVKQDIHILQETKRKDTISEYRIAT